jgi:hypothetical protein
MKKLMLGLATAGLMTIPAAANAEQFEFAKVRSGAFAGARFQIALGGRTKSKPRASLTVAPTMTRNSGNNGVRTSIGQGVALNFGQKPTLTLSGIRADQALGLTPSKDADAKQKFGVSTGGWIGLGIGVLAVAGGLYFVHLVDEARDNSD